MTNKSPTPPLESDPFVYSMKKLPAMFGFAMATVVAFADPLPEGGPYKEMVDGIEWTFMVDANLNASVESGCNSIAAIPRLTVGDIVIPAALGGHPVTIVGDFAFYQCDDLTSVTIPFGITSIGSEAFTFCDGIVSVVIPSSVTSIKDSAFEYCYGLTSITIPSSVTNIGHSAFSGSTNLQSIKVDDSNDYYSSQDGVLFDKDKEVLVQCPGGKTGTYSIPEGVTSIATGAFNSCRGLTSVMVPSSVTNVGKGPFWDCSHLQTIEVDGENAEYSSHDGVLFNKDGASLIRCPSGRAGEYAIASGVTNLEWEAFFECRGLTNVTISSSVRTVGDYAFYCCSGLKSVTISEGVTNFGEWSFAHCRGLTSVAIPSSVANVDSYAFYGCEGIEWLRTSNGLKNIGDSAFEYCRKLNLRYCGLPSSVTNIGDRAFCGCSRLESVTIPSGVKRIGAYAFSNCTSLYGVTIPEGVTCIGASAFEGCGLSDITIPASVTNIGAKAFSNCDDLWGGINVDAGNKNYASVDGVLFDKEIKTLITFPGGKDGPYEIPSSVTHIGEYAFSYCYLTYVTIPSSVTSIGYRAFYSCSGLKSVTIPEGVANIGEEAFYSCYGPTNIMISSSVTNIGHLAFSVSSKLQSIEVDDGNAYYSSQDGVLFDKDKTVVIQCPGGKKGAYSIPEGVMNISDKAFSRCTSLTSVTIPSSVTSVGAMAFSRCSGLTSVAMSPSVTNIGDGAFGYCASLTSVTIPFDVTSVGDWAFGGCNHLAVVDFECAPPFGVASASINQDAAIRYNVKYFDEWQPIIKQCGWTNAKPYSPNPGFMFFLR